MADHFIFRFLIALCCLSIGTLFYPKNKTRESQHELFTEDWKFKLTCLALPFIMRVIDIYFLPFINTRTSSRTYFKCVAALAMMSLLDCLERQYKQYKQYDASNAIKVQPLRNTLSQIFGPSQRMAPLFKVEGN